MKNLLQADPTDGEFRRGVMRLWSSRPAQMRELDDIYQGGIHNGSSVSDHQLSVVMRLETDWMMDPSDVVVARIVALDHDEGKRNDPADPKHPQKSAELVEAHLMLMGIMPGFQTRIQHIIANHHLLGDVVQGLRPFEDIGLAVPTLGDLRIFHAVTRADISSIEPLRRSGVLSQIDGVVRAASLNFPAF